MYIWYVHISCQIKVGKSDNSMQYEYFHIISTCGKLRKDKCESWFGMQKYVPASFWTPLKILNATEQRFRDFVSPVCLLTTLLYNGCIVSILNILVSYDDDSVWVQLIVCCFCEKMHLEEFLILLTVRWNAWRALVNRFLTSPVPHRDHFGYKSSHWETTLQCNVASHWLGSYTIWSLPDTMYGHVSIRMTNWVLNRMIRYMGT